MEQKLVEMLERIEQRIAKLETSYPDAVRWMCEVRGTYGYIYMGQGSTAKEAYENATNGRKAREGK